MTCLGINNEGKLVFDYYHEDDDQLDGANVYNGATSTLWVNFRESFPDEIQELYAEWRSLGLLSYDKIIEYFITRQSDKWSISVYNEDADFKYVSMLRSDNDSTYLYQIRGTGEEHLKYFVKNRLAYCDAKWCCGDYPSNYVSLRIYTPMDSNGNPRTDLAVPANPDIAVTPYSNTYAGVQFGAGSAIAQYKAEKNTPITLPWTMDGHPNDLETSVFPASEISSLGDLSPLYCGTVNVSKATKLTELIIGSGVKGYVNNNLTELSVGSNNLLQKVDVRNCPNLTEPLALANCPSIQEIYATGSGITGIELPSSGYLKKVYLPATLTNLTVTNQQYIEEFQLDGYDELTTLRIENTVGIPVEDIMLNAPKLNRIRLLDVTWAAESEEALAQTIEKFKSCLGLDAAGNNTDNAIVTGRVTVPSISDELYNDIYENFPDLIVDDGSDEIYILCYKDRDGKTLYVTRVAEGSSAFDPIEKGYVKKPDPIETETYRHEFIGWSTLPTNVSKHYVITAQYHTKFAIKFYNESILIYKQWSIQGDTAADPVENGSIEAPTKAGTNDMSYKFSGWDNLPVNVQSSISVYAQYDIYWAARFNNDGVLYLLEWVKDGSNVVEPKDYFDDYVNPTRESTAQYDFVFSKWEGDFGATTAAKDFTAVYNNITRKYPVHFYNDNILVKTVENVSYGSSVPSSNYPPNPTKTGVEDPEEYVFKGWMPLPENITGETNCYALYKFTGYLFGKLGKTDGEDYGYGTVDNPNWDTINTYWVTINSDVESYKSGTMSEDSFIEKYPIGGRMIIPVTLSTGTVIADVEVIGHNHDNFADNSGKAPLTFFCVDLPKIEYRMNDNNDTTEGGWRDCDMRAFVNGDLFNALPDQLKSIIKSVYKISDGGVNNKTLVTTEDKIWIASYDEVGFDDGSYGLLGQGSLYKDIFSTDKKTRIKTIIDDTAAGGWWLRSTYYGGNSNTLFIQVTKTGGSYGYFLWTELYVAFGFCV